MTLPLLFLLAIALVATIPAITLAKPAFVEDELGPLAVVDAATETTSGSSPAA